MNEKRAFVLGVLSGVIGNIISAPLLPYFLLVGGSISGGAAALLRGLTDFERAILYTLAFVSMALALVVGLYRHSKTRADRNAWVTLPEPRPKAPAHVSSDHIIHVAALATNPLITLSLPFTRGNRLLVTVHNHGATADFFAKLHVEGLLRSHPEGEVFCRWNHTDQHITEIPGGVPFDLFLAMLRAPELKGRWCVQYVTGNDVLGETEHQRTFYPGTPVPIGPVRVDDLPRIAAEPKMTPREFLQGELAKLHIPNAYRKECVRELSRLDLLPAEVTEKKAVAEAIVTLSVDLFAKPQIIDSKTRIVVRLRGPEFEALPEAATGPNEVLTSRAEKVKPVEETREQVRVRTILAKLPLAQWQVLTLLAREGPQSLSQLDMDVLNLTNSQLIESVGPGVAFMEHIYRLHPDSKDAVIEGIARGRHLR